MLFWSFRDSLLPLDSQEVRNQSAVYGASGYGGKGVFALYFNRIFENFDKALHPFSILKVVFIF